MSRTVHELRNDIRRAVGRFEREIAAEFTKEDLAAVCGAVGYEIDEDRLPPTARMRGGILWRIGERDADEPHEGSFRKAELAAIAEYLEG